MTVRKPPIKGYSSRKSSPMFKRTARIFKAMFERCYYEKSQNYKYYGGKGITIDPRWVESFDNFVDDMGLAEMHQSIDRRDNNLGYSAKNCRWVDSHTQNLNKTNNLFYNGYTINEIANMYNLPQTVVSARFRVQKKTGWELLKPLDQIIRLDYIQR